MVPGADSFLSLLIHFQSAQRGVLDFAMLDCTSRVLESPAPAMPLEMTGTGLDMPAAAITGPWVFVPHGPSGLKLSANATTSTARYEDQGNSDS